MAITSTLLTTSPTLFHGHAVMRTAEDITVMRTLGPLPLPGPNQARIRMVAASICGADVRIACGDKDAHATTQKPVTMGHEGCGIIDALPDGATTHLRLGDLVVVLPHIHVSPERAGGCTRTTTSIEAVCTSRHHTEHGGWDFDGVFSDVGVFPLPNLVLVPPEQISQAVHLAPDLGQALFTITEPFLCCLSAYEVMGREVHAWHARSLQAGRALVVGCGPIGIMHGIILAERGYAVSFYDPIPQRARLAQYCLGGGHLLLDPDTQRDAFDVVVVTANVLDAIRCGERAVKDTGVLYLFAGMNAADRQARHPDGVFSYELVHRLAQGVLTWTHGKRVLYVGHSGYDASLGSKAIAMVAANAARLERLITGIIPGWDSPVIAARVPGVGNYQTYDSSPAILSVLKGTADVRQHGKLIVRPGN